MVLPAVASPLLQQATHPFFPTDVVANAKGELLMTDKGVKRVDVFSPDGKTLLRSFPMDEAPTGILLMATRHM